ncbi:MAG TPA: TraB/GumN family protein, partial [Caulobacteraceae bacterium]|nr:TraB/GumN family protein [Caulobacteraceae bacterium]
VRAAMLRSRFAILTALFCLLAGAARAEAPVWIARAHGTTVVLFGSVHVLPQRIDWEPPRLKAAIAKADDLWFEIPLDDASTDAAGRLARTQGEQPAGQTLSAELSDKGRKKLAKVAKAVGVPVERLDGLKPWYAEILLSLFVYQQVGAGDQTGVERQLSHTAPASVRRRAFETAEEQIGFLAGAPLPDQVASLEETLDELETGPASYEKLVTAWMAGDTHAIVKQALDPMMKQAPGAYRTLVTERNRRWVEVILKRLNEGGEAVVVVGVGHLVGPGGLPALLRARGVAVEGP